MRILKRAVLATALAAAPTLAAAEETTFRFQEYPGVGVLLMKVAISKGYCTEQGLKCEPVIIPSAALGAQSILGGSVDMITVPIEAQAAAVSKGADFVAVVGLSGTSGGVLAVNNEVDLSGADDLVAKMQRLKGKKVGVAARGTAGEFAVRFMLRDAGLTEDDVTFVAVGGLPTGLPALTGGQVDALLSIEPLGAICEVLGSCQVAWRQTEDDAPAELVASRGATNPGIVRRGWLEDNAETLAAVRAALIKAEAFAQDPANFDEVVAIVGETVNFDLPKSDEILAETIRQLLPYQRATIDMEAADRGMDLAVPLFGAKHRVDVEEIVDADAPKS